MQSLYAVILFDGNSMIGHINIVSMTMPASILFEELCMLQTSIHQKSQAETFDVWMFGAYTTPQIKKYSKKMTKKWVHKKGQMTFINLARTVFDFC